MRKILPVVVVMLFALAMLAQQPGSSDPNANPGASQYPNPSGQSGTQPSSQSGVGQEPSSSTSGQMGQSHKAEKALEGCIVREEADYFLVLKRGSVVKLTGAENLSPHVGHHVKVYGEKSALASTATGTSTEPAAPGAVAGKAGSVAAAGAAHAQATDQIAVERVEMISDNCPASIKKNAPGSMEATPSGETTPPEPK